MDKGGLMKKRVGKKSHERDIGESVRSDRNVLGAKFPRESQLMDRSPIDPQVRYGMSGKGEGATLPQARFHLCSRGVAAMKEKDWKCGSFVQCLLGSWKEVFWVAILADNEGIFGGMESILHEPIDGEGIFADDEALKPIVIDVWFLPFRGRCVEGRSLDEVGDFSALACPCPDDLVPSFSLEKRTVGDHEQKNEQGEREEDDGRRVPERDHADEGQQDDGSENDDGGEPASLEGSSTGVGVKLVFRDETRAVPRGSPQEGEKTTVGNLPEGAMVFGVQAKLISAFSAPHAFSAAPLVVVAFWTLHEVGRIVRLTMG